MFVFLFSVFCFLFSVLFSVLGFGRLSFVIGCTHDSARLAQRTKPHGQRMANGPPPPRHHTTTAPPHRRRLTVRMSFNHDYYL